MKSIWAMKLALCLLLLGTLTDAQALTLNFKAVNLSADQRASLKAFLVNTSPALVFDWNSLEANSRSIAGKRQPLSVAMRTVPAWTASGICRSELHHFYVATGNGRWHENEDLTSLQAWAAQGGDCAGASSPIDVDKSLSDMDFLTIERGSEALRKRATQVIGGSDCIRVLKCEVTLRRINRVRQESPSRVLTKLTFSPTHPGPACLYVMEVSFVGPPNNLVPLGASCPMP